MIWSHYNEFILDHNREFVLFNCRTRKWIYLVPELYFFLKEKIDNPIQIKTHHPSLYQILVNNKFIVSSIETEISECIAEISSRLDSSDILRLIVNPTLDCNLRCWYCYEHHVVGSSMNQTTINSINKYVEQSLISGKFKRFHLSFFGGEPLMKFDQVILPLIVSAKEICNKHKVEFGISFTTNGVLLTQRILAAVHKYTSKVSVQIPFDGDSDSHNCVKKFPNGKGSYQIVLKNAKSAVEKGFKVTVRCNVTKKNISSFHNVINDFEDILKSDNLRFSFHKVWQEPDDEEFKNGVKKLKEAITDYSFDSNIHSYFGDSINPCYGDYADNYVFNYNGDVFKCTARDFKTEHRIGHLNENGTIDFNGSALIRSKKSMTSDCPTCRRLPFCPICSQVRSESKDGKCPVNIQADVIQSNIHQLYLDLSNQPYI